MIPELQVRRQGEVLSSEPLHLRFALGAFWSLSGAVVARITTLAAAVVCSRLLGRRGFGELSIIQSTAAMFAIFAGLGLGLTATKCVAEHRQKDRLRAGRILALCALAAPVSAGLIALLFILVAPVLAKSTLAAPHLAGSLAIGSGLVFFGALNSAQTGALSGFEAFKSIARVNFWSGLFLLPLVALGVVFGGLEGALWGLVAAMGVNWLLNHRALRQECAEARIAMNFSSCQNEWRVLYQLSLPAFLGAVLVGPAMWACNALLAQQPGGYEELGIFSAADKWRSAILFVPASFFSLSLPMLSSFYGVGDWLAYKKTFRANLLINVGLIVPAALAIAALAAPIMSIYGSSFRAGGLVLTILAMSTIVEMLNAVLGQALVSTNRMWWRFAFDLLLAAALFSVSWWLVPQWGAAGLSIAYAIAFAITSCGLWLLLRFRLSELS